MNIYSVLDRVASEGSPLFEAKNDACALRIFHRDLLKVAANESEYQLLRLGSIDHERSVISPLEVPVLVQFATGTEVEDNA